MIYCKQKYKKTQETKNNVKKVKLFNPLQYQQLEGKCPRMTMCVNLQKGSINLITVYSLHP